MAVRAADGPDSKEGSEEADGNDEETEDGAIETEEGDASVVPFENDEELVGIADARPRKSAPGARADQADNLIVMVCVRMCVKGVCK